MKKVFEGFQTINLPGPNKPKYGNRKVELDGLTFDSRAEAIRWGELKMLERTGVIRDLRRQVAYTLIPSFRGPDGKAVRAVNYVADFVYEEVRPAKDRGFQVASWQLIIEDCKGFRTKDYILKRKLLLWLMNKGEIEGIFRETAAKS